MSISIDLDEPHATRTNNDLISGRVNFFVKTNVKLSTVHVKLEAESQSQIMRCFNPVTGGAATETHKILYQCQKLFPGSCPDLLPTLSSTLRAGRHEFAFSFPIPLETDCHDQQHVLPDMGLGNLCLANIRKRGQRDHVKQILPPSLTGLPGLAKISYYVKATIRFSSIFRESLRSIARFKFSPLTPLSAMCSGDSFKTTRIPFEFQEKISFKAEKWGKNGLNIPSTTPRGELFIRLPQPANFICSKHVKVKVDGMARIDSSTWVVANVNGLSMEIGSVSDEEGAECFISQALWNQSPIPNSLGPSFRTCNISRSYELDIRVGLGFGMIENEIQHQVIILPYRVPIEIFSGITSLSCLASPSSLTRDYIGSPTNDFISPQSLVTLDSDAPPPSYEKAVAVPR